MNTSAFPSGSLSGLLEQARQDYLAGVAGPFPEMFCTPDTGAPRPGLSVSSTSPTDYSAESLRELRWTCQEYATRQGRRMVHGRHATGLSWDELLTTVRAFGYDAGAPYWKAG